MLSFFGLCKKTQVCAICYDASFDRKIANRCVVCFSTCVAKDFCGKLIQPLIKVGCGKWLAAYFCVFFHS